jgi:hypothetical protein
MPALPRPRLLDNILRTLPRRYRVPALAGASAAGKGANPTTTLAVTIEQARATLARGEAPDASLQTVFVDALASLIHDAMRADAGDPAFQALVLKHRAPRVREYALLAATADQDGRRLRTTVDAIAHPAKLQRAGADVPREMLGQLYAAAASASWPMFADVSRQLLRLPAVTNAPPLAQALERLLDDPALARLQRFAELAPDELVQAYRALWDRHGPRSGTPAATEQGSIAQQRGAAVEASAAKALVALAQRLNDAEGAQVYRVVTSMRVPATIPGNADRAKSEWDAVLLRQASTDDGTPAWDICLLVEVKASVDAATTDLLRLLRGLQLLAQADPEAIYCFATRQGELRLRGKSLAALSTDEAELPSEVLYCCDAPADPSPRLLGAASRVQLLSAEASLAFAARLADHQPGDARELEPIWLALLSSTRWTAVLNQYPLLRSVRELMVHVADLSAAIEASVGAR